ncbi:MAG: DUF5053 domain-containing protein [Clostridium sp.]|nr:DUF5053 domain-containing protein [Clostridium sp.]
MIQEKLNELDKLIKQNPTSPQLLVLAAEIKNACATHEEEKLIEEFVGSRLPKLSSDIDQLHNEVTKFQLGEISDMINLSYIAKRYFNKSRAWLSQRVNGNIVNGRPCRFTPSELNTFNAALRDMSMRLAAVAVKY